jgi:uncharacterized SAM-binding protein YcdF (DUF218 family)
MTDDHRIHARARRGKRWAWGAAAFLAIAVVLYALSPAVLRSVGEQLIHADPVQRADAIIVLAPFLDRIMEAADLYRQGYAPTVILTRGQRDIGEQELIDRGIIESSEERKRQVLVALGVAPAAIVILDPLVDSTADEAQAFAEWARRHPIRRVIVVTSPLHTGRSRLTFMRAVENLPIDVLVRPSSRNPFRSDTWWRRRDTFRDGLIEFQKLVYYRLVELPRLIPPAAPSANEKAKAS